MTLPGAAHPAAQDASPAGAAGAAPLAQPAISLTGVTKRFARRGESLLALDGVDLNVAAGEFVALIGPSGCGKSTLLRLIAGLLDPDSGTVAIEGLAAHQARRAKRFGLVPQTPALLPWRSVRANIALLGEVNRTSGAPPANGEAIEQLIDAVGLRGFENARPAELSGGMQQRVALARAFALGAPVLLMDEPFAALDEITRENMRFLLSRVWAEGDGAARRTVVFVTHSIEEAVTLADRVVVLSSRPGRVVDQVRITLDRPRLAEQEDTDEFVAHVRQVRAVLRTAAGRRTP